MNRAAREAAAWGRVAVAEIQRACERPYAITTFVRDADGTERGVDGYLENAVNSTIQAVREGRIAQEQAHAR